MRKLLLLLATALLAPVVQADTLPRPFVQNENVIAVQQLGPTAFVVYYDRGASTLYSETVHHTPQQSTVVGTSTSGPTYFETSWVDNLGVTHTVHTARPTSGSTLAIKRARLEHIQAVQDLQTAFPPTVPPPPQPGP